MHPEWKRLRHDTAAAQVTFLEAEADTGITLARIAMGASDPQKISRNTRSARKAYETLNSYIADLPPNTPGLDPIREKMNALQSMLLKLEKRA